MFEHIAASLTVTIFLMKYFSITVKDVFKSIKLIWKNLSRDSRALFYYIRVHYFILKCRLLNHTVISRFRDVVRKYPDKVAIYYNEEEWTFKQLDTFTNQVANYFAAIGYVESDELALLMDNRPEFIGIWLGLAKAGIITSFINTNNKNQTLIHALSAINNCKAIIYDSKLAQNVENIKEELLTINPSLNYFIYGDDNCHHSNDGTGAKPLRQLIKSSYKKLPVNKYRPKFNDKLIYLFTSGTTGFPKAAIIPHSRFLWGCTTNRIVLNFRPQDIVYLALPLYHGNAGLLGTGQAIIHGNSIVLRERFSASHFWDDCVKYKCTVAIYIGEICRYLLAQPIKYSDQNHSVRVMCGNGLRPQIWTDFAQRFNIKLIAEFYASTEGNANLINFTGHMGAIGFYPYYYRLGTINLVKYLYPVSLIKVSENFREVVRDCQSGLCVAAKPGETGQIVGMIVDSDPVSQFVGYVSERENHAKIVRNVFKAGDKGFLSGDLLRIDENGFIYFQDRIGDTFRWKGENVSTNEVEAILQKVTHLSDCVVFGVTIANCEGKAGMAVIAYEHSADIAVFMQCLAKQLTKQLPTYAIPLFIRLAKSIELTGSFKLTKFKFYRTGFNPNETTDQIYFYERKKLSYIPLDHTLYENIQRGKIIL